MVGVSSKWQSSPSPADSIVVLALDEFAETFRMLFVAHSSITQLIHLSMTCNGYVSLTNVFGTSAQTTAGVMAGSNTKRGAEPLMHMGNPGGSAWLAIQLDS